MVLSEAAIIVLGAVDADSAADAAADAVAAVFGDGLAPGVVAAFVTVVFFVGAETVHVEVAFCYR